MSGAGARFVVDVVMGTRPEVVKLAPVVKAFASSSAGSGGREGAGGCVECRVVATAQHRELLDSMLEVFGIRADVDLDLMRRRQELNEFASRALSALGVHLAGGGGLRPPDMVLVQGDTTTAFVACLAAYYRRIPCGHVEAGLRSGDLFSPYPEEGNRSLIGRIADLHFAPTESARDNLLREGVEDERILVCGNTVVDALVSVQERLERTGAPPSVAALLERTRGRARILLTAHRRESFGEPLERLFRAVRTLVERNPGVAVIYPVHPNPAVEGPARELLGGVEGVFLVPPLDYLEFNALLPRCRLVMSDSGGIQEEAPSFGIPVLVLREVTERPEAVELGLNELVGTDPDRILEAAPRRLAECLELAGGDKDGPLPPTRPNPYGDGHAARRIAAAVESFLCDGRRNMRDRSGAPVRG